MPPSTARDFAGVVGASGLAPDDTVRDQVQKLYASVHDAEPTAKQLATQMVRANLLTRYQANHLLAGRTQGFFFDNYKVLERVGKGSMGKVYKAVDVRLGRPVALKVLRRDLTNTPRLVARFKREGAASARLEHPNVVRTYDLGKWRDLHYIVFEFVEGVNLKALLLKKGKMRPSKAVDIALQVADALEHARKNGVVHRDLKPSNIVLTRDGQAKILDMGLARIKQRDDQADQAGVITQVGEIVGTFDYIAPEQALDTSGADTRSDLYSLGCTLYHMVTGQPPFPGGTALEKITAHQQQTPTPTKEIESGLSDELDAIILKLIDKDPAARYQTPADLAVELRKLAAGMSQHRVLNAMATGPDPQASSASIRLAPASSSVISTLTSSADLVAEPDSSLDIRGGSSSLMREPQPGDQPPPPAAPQPPLPPPGRPVWLMMAVGTLVGIIVTLLLILLLL